MIRVLCDEIFTTLLMENRWCREVCDVFISCSFVVIDEERGTNDSKLLGSVYFVMASYYYSQLLLWRDLLVTQ